MIVLHECSANEYFEGIQIVPYRKCIVVTLKIAEVDDVDDTASF